MFRFADQLIEITLKPLEGFEGILLCSIYGKDPGLIDSEETDMVFSELHSKILADRRSNVLVLNVCGLAFHLSEHIHSYFAAGRAGQGIAVYLILSPEVIHREFLVDAWFSDFPGIKVLDRLDQLTELIGKETDTND